VAHHLVFATQPATSAAGANLLPVVRIVDVNNNIVTTDDRTITLTFFVNPTGATLNGDVDLPTVNGVATWTAVEAMNITVAAAGYRLQAGHDGAPFTGTQTVNSNNFTINPAAHDHLVFSTEPVDTLAGNDLLPAVRIQDVYNNNCTATPNRSIQLSIITNPGGAALNGTVSKNTASGIATWTAVESLDITVPAAGYQLRATNLTAPPLPGGDTVDSAAFTISHHVADHMDFTTQPVDTAAGAALLPTVTIQDAYHNTCTSDNRNITLGFSANPGGAVLNGTVTLLSVNGVATWTGLEAMNVTVAASGYQFQASHDGAAFSGSDTVDSAAFNITGGNAHHLTFTTQPTSPTTAGADLLPAVAIQDQYGNTVTWDNRTITLSFAANPGGALLNGIVSKATVGGVATWGPGEGLSINVAANNYQLQAAHDGADFPGPDTTDSDAFNIAAEAAHHLAFSVDPANSPAGEWLLPTVLIQDVYGNTVTGDNRTVTLTLMNAGGATLNGTKSLLTVGGVAQWTGGQAMNVTQPGSNYYLQASHDGVAFAGSDIADSGDFEITHNVPHHLVFSTQPVNTTAGQTLLPAVGIQDLYDNTCTGDVRTITMSISTNPGGAALNGTVALLSVNGVATWTGLETMNITTAAAGYRLRATGSGAFAGSDNVDSSLFNITAVPSLSAFTIAASANPITVNNPITLTITARDTYNNPIPSFLTTQVINLTTTTGGDGTDIDWDNGPAGLTDHLDGTADIAAGCAFNAAGAITLDITNRKAESITVTADDPVTPATGTSAAIQWDAWFALLLHIAAPVLPVAGAPFDVDISVTDQFGNPSNVVQNCGISLRKSSGTGTLGGVLTETILAGTDSVTISGLTYDVAEDNVVLVIDRLNGDFLVAGISDPFTVIGATPEALRVSAVANQTAGTPFSVIVTAIDGYGNPSDVSADTGISLSLFLGSGVLSGTTTGTITAGTSSVTINGVQLNTSQDGAAIQASRTSGDVLTSAESNSFLVSAAPASKLGFDILGNQIADTLFIATVRIYDNYDNSVGVSADTDVTLSLATGTGTLGGTLSQTIAMGENSALFSITYDTVEAGVSLQADRTSGDVLASATSNVFAVNPSPPVQLKFESVGWASAGSAFSVTVMATDLAGNEGTVDVDTTVKITLNSGNGTLSGNSTGVITAGSGRTTINGLVYNVAESRVSLKASSIAGELLADGTSPQFNVSPGPPQHLRFSQQPVNTDIGTFITVIVEVTDSIGNRVSLAGEVTLSLVSPAGCDTVLEGTTTAGGFGGLITFSVRVPVPCDAYRLTASASGLTGATSDPFNVVGGTDLVGNSVSLLVSDQQTLLSLSYTIWGMSSVNPFTLRWGLERDSTNAEAIDEVHGIIEVSGEADLVPGVHSMIIGDVRPFLTEQFRYGDRVVVQIDADDTVVETREDNNFDGTTPAVNLVNRMLRLRPRGDEPMAEVTYVVDSPIDVSSFGISVGFDTDGDGQIDDSIAQSRVDGAGLAPGLHVVGVSLLSAFDSGQIGAGQEITLAAQLNPGQEWPESTPVADNLQSAVMTYPADLVLLRLDHNRTVAERVFDVTITYQVADMPVSEEFAIAFYASTDNADSISEGDIKVDQFVIRDMTERTHGAHSRQFQVSVPITVLPGADFVLKARLDDGGIVNELDETNNVMAMPRYTSSTRHVCGLIGAAPLACCVIGLLGMKRRIRARSPKAPSEPGA